MTPRAVRICGAAAAVLLLLSPLLTALICLGVGRMEIPLPTVLRVFARKLGGEAPESLQISVVVLGIRLPRVLLALLVGAGLSCAGASFQSLFANPLATPDTLGVAAGASFGAALGLLLGMELIAVQLIALAMGGAAVVLTCLVGVTGQSRGKVAVVLAGLVVSSVFSALVSLVKFVADADSQLPAITYWLMGSLSGAGYASLALGAPFILAGMALIFALRWRLNVLPLSDDEARATGVRLGPLRLLTALSATMITASAVSICGQIGWVGLLVPHVCRMALGSDARKIIPASMCAGAAFLVIIDTLARSLAASEIPISILTAIIGAPFFIVLLRRTGGWSL